MKTYLIIAAAVIAALSAADAFAANVNHGKQFYATCAACHGPRGGGNKALNAPPIAGLPVWYTTRQLNNFKNGARGSNPKDTYGRIMVPMAQQLATGQDVADVTAYIATLK